MSKLSFGTNAGFSVVCPRALVLEVSGFVPARALPVQELSMHTSESGSRLRDLCERLRVFAFVCCVSRGKLRPAHFPILGKATLFCENPFAGRRPRGADENINSYGRNLCVYLFSWSIDLIEMKCYLRFEIYSMYSLMEIL